MGIGGISIWQLLIILAVVVLIFGSGKLKSLRSDLALALKDLKKLSKMRKLTKTLITKTYRNCFR